jgi:hypothetical protein
MLECEHGERMCDIVKQGAQVGKIFISYRREASPAESGRIYDRLWPRYGRENVFKDVDNIPLGADFRRILSDAVAQCDVMLVIIGRQWVSITDAQGQRRQIVVEAGGK